MANHYTKNITMAKASDMPKYMQVLKAIKWLDDLYGYATKERVVRKVWGKKLGRDVSKNWQDGPFTLLKNQGLAQWTKQKNGWVDWQITDKGRKFLADCEAKFAEQHVKRTGLLKIDVAGPAYRGAPYPKFDPKKVNESKFDFASRGKEWSLCIKTNAMGTKIGEVEWLSQDRDDPTDEWETEIIRAFKENGLEPWDTINVKFGSRDTGYIHEYTLNT